MGRLQYPVASFLNRIASRLPLPAPSSLEDFRRMVRQRAPRVYDEFYQRFAPFEGRDVAELGAGWGFAIEQYLSHEPRRYYALDVAHTAHIAESCRDHPLFERVEVVPMTSSAIPLPDECVDVVISENTFEHAIEYGVTVSECRRILRRGGVLAAMFAPLYYSPYGAHLWHIVKFPWLHLMTDAQALRRIFYAAELPKELEFDHDYHWEQYLTLNRLTPRDFLAPFRSPQWQLVHVSSYPLPLAHRAPRPLSALLTNGLRIVAERRD